MSDFRVSEMLPAYIEAMAGGRLAAARVAALFNVARPAYYATLANAAILLVVLWGAFPPTLLGSWFGALLALTGARLWLHRRYLAAQSMQDAERWESRFALGALAAGALWTFPPAVFFPQSDPLLQMAVIFVVGGNVIGAAGVYAPSPAAFYGFSPLPLVAVVVQLALQPGRTYQLLALMVLVFAGVMVRVFGDIHRSIVRTLRTQIENEALVERLGESESQLRDAIQSFPEGIAIFDAQDRLIVCNEVYAGLYGGGRFAPELVGASYETIAGNAYDVEEIAPEFEGRREAWVAERLARRTNVGTARHVHTRAGRTLQAVFVRSQGGGMVSAFTDVTDLRGAQDALGMVLEEETLLLDTLPVGVAFISGGLIVRCNRRLEQMLGYRPGELNRKPARALHAEAAFWHNDRELAVATRSGGELWCRIWSRNVGGQPGQGWSIVAFSDVSETHVAAQALEKSEALFRNLVETSNDLVWSIDAEARWSYLSPGATRRIYGREPGELLGQSLRQVMAPELFERDLAVFHRVLAGEAVFDFETRHAHGDGHLVDLSFNAVPLRDAAGKVVGATGAARDITREKAAAAALHESVEKLRLAVDIADLDYWEWDRDTDTMHFGRAPQAGALGVPRIAFAEYLRNVHEEDRERLRDASLATQQRGEPYEMEFRVVDQGGRVRWMHARGKAITDRAGQIHRVIGVSQDVTERKRQEEETRFLAYHDTLTGLPNRRLLDDRLAQALFLAQRRDTRVAVMLIDLDRFKQVNDQLGHRAGDEVLREAAHRLAGCVRKADTVARHGGDEFVVVIPDLQSGGECQVVAEKILRALETPFRIDGRDFSIGASIGITVYPADAGDGEGLLRNADVAMYRAKQRKGNSFRYYAR